MTVCSKLSHEALLTNVQAVVLAGFRAEEPAMVSSMTLTTQLTQCYMRSKVHKDPTPALCQTCWPALSAGYLNMHIHDAAGQSNS